MSGERWDTSSSRRPLADWIQAEIGAVPTGAINPSNYGDTIYAAIRSHYEEFQACYQAQLKVMPDLYGDLAVVFRVDADGSVRNPVVDFSSLQGPGIEPCLLEVFAGLTLPAPPREGFSVRYPMVFTSPATPPEIVTVLKKRYGLRSESEGGSRSKQRDDYEAPW